MNPSLRLTRELIDQIVFGMENQERDFVLDTSEEAVIPADQMEDDAQEEDRYVDLPEWRSVDGYNLMEQFVATLHNPIYRTRLRSILSSGRGVFRQFKDTVRERREIERLWFNFKERAMRDLVTDWFNDMREREGLERLESMTEETETDQLIESDFVFRKARTDELPMIARLDRDAFAEVLSDADANTVGAYYTLQRTGAPAADDPASTVFVAETQGGDFAGFAWLVATPSADITVGSILQLYILPEYRGFGLAREMLQHLFHHAHAGCMSELHLPLHGSALDLEPSFAAYGLARRSVLMSLDVRRWHRSEST